MDGVNQMINSEDVHGLVEQLSKTIQKAIILEDINFELIAYSAPNEHSFDEIQQKTILTKRCPLYVIEHLKKEGIINRLQREPKPIRIHLLEDTHFYQRVAISVMYNSKLFGYLWIYGADESFDRFFLKQITITANQIGEKLYEESIQEKNYQKESLLWKLVNEEVPPKHNLTKETKQTLENIPKKITIVVISVKDVTFLSLLDKAKQLFVSFDMLYDSGKGTEIIGLLASENKSEICRQINQFINKLEKIFPASEQKEMLIGLGNTYKKKNIRTSYLEALEVIETISFLNLSHKTVYFYKDLGLLRHLKLMYKKNVSEEYRNKKIVTLLNKDIQEKSELVKTVWNYLKNDCKANKTANQMFIHPNTLHYRLRQVKNLVDIDFTNIMEKMEIYIELYLLFHVRDYKEFYDQYILI